MIGKSPRGRPAKTKIFWSDTERIQITKRAADLMDERPGLSGLPLLRAALEILPEDRRRGLIALSQARWFTRMVQEEVDRREMERRAQDDTTGILREHRAHHESWMEQQLSRFDRMVPALERVAHETEEHRRAFAKMMSGDREWKERTLEFNRQAVELLAQNTQATKEHAERAAQIAALMENQREVVKLLGQLCAEMHDLNVRLAAVEE